MMKQARPGIRLVIQMAELGTIIGLIKTFAPKADPEEIEQAVSDWLDDHPEATTTVEDGSITKAKLDSDLQDTVDDVQSLKTEINSGPTEETGGELLKSEQENAILTRMVINAIKGWIENIDKMRPDATDADIGKALIVKTVSNGKPELFEYGEAGGGGGDLPEDFPTDETAQELLEEIEKGKTETSNVLKVIGDIIENLPTDEKGHEIADKIAESNSFLRQIYREITAENKREKVNKADYFEKGASLKTEQTGLKLCIIGAGQSNIEGRNPTNDLPSDISLPMSGLKYISKSLTGTFASSFPNAAWGFDLVVCHELIKNLGDGNLYYIKWAEGGTSIDPTGGNTQYWTADYEELDDLSASLLLKFNKEIEMCEKENPDEYYIGAMIWHQGEGDCFYKSKTARYKYYDNLKKVIAYCRGMAKNKRLPFICGTISHASQEYDPKVEEAVLRLASEDPYMWVVDMQDAELQDAYHFNAEWSEYFGKKVYDCLIDAGVITGTKINPSKPV